MSYHLRPTGLGYQRRTQPETEELIKKEWYLESNRSSYSRFIPLLVLLLLLVVVGWIIYAFARPLPMAGEMNNLNQTATIQSLVDAFARTMTQQDWHGNAALFVAGGTSLANFRRALTFLVPSPTHDLVVDATPPISPAGSWRHQLEVYAGGYSSNHMMLTNCNMSLWRPPSMGAWQAAITCVASYTYTLSYSVSVNTSAYPSFLTYFQVHFDAVQNAWSAAPHYAGWQLTYALALPNATTTLLSSVDTGVAPPGAVTTRRRDLTDLAVVWTTLLSQVQALLENDQIQAALAVCKTMQFQDLELMFDPLHNDSGILCHDVAPAPVYIYSPLVCTDPAYALDSSCLPDHIRTINGILPEASIPPIVNSLDFTITGGFGIAISAGMHGLTIHNVGLTAIPLIGTPELDFEIQTFPVPTLIVVKLNQSANTVWAGPPAGPDQPPEFRALVLADIPLIDLATHVTGVLPLVNGGTGNTGPYAGGRIIVSNAGGTALEEAPAMPDGFFPVADGAGGFQAGTIVPGDGINITYSGGIFTVINLETQTVVEVDLAVPTDIFQVISSPILVNGTLEFVTLAQGANKVWVGPASGPDAVPAFRVLEEVDMAVISLSGTKVSGVLPVLRGGTNHDGSGWVGERVMMSNTGGTTITEGTVTGQGGISVSYGPGAALVISGTGGTCSENDTISQSCLDISELSCPAGALANNCIPGALVINSLGVTGATSLGTSTICTNPLNANCVDISTQSCPGGPLNANCVPSNLELTTLTVNNLIAYDITLVNGTLSAVEQGQFEILNVTFANTDYINLLGTMTCTPPSGMIDTGCFDISGKICTSPLDASCFPSSYTFNNVSVVDTITVNQVVCAGNPIPDTCTPRRVKTINGILPTVSPGLDFTLAAGTGISITPIVNGLTIATTGVTSVGLSLPSSILSVTVSPVTTTGTLTAVLQTQMANTFWGGPVSGPDAAPTFRALAFADFPTAASTSSVYFVNGAGVLDVTSLSLSLSVPSAEFAIAGSPITNPTGTFTVTKQNQAANSFWAGPTMGSPAQPAFRAMTLGDLTALGLTNGQVLTGVTSSAPVGKTLVAGTNMMITEMAGSFVFDAEAITGIQNLTLTVPSWLSVSPTTLYASGTFDITANTQAANTFLAGPTSGGAAVPGFRAMGYGDLPALADGQMYIGQTGSPPVPTQLTAGSLISITPGPGTSTVATSALGMVTLTMPTDTFNVGTSFGTNSETLAVTYKTQTANTFLAGPTGGAAATPSWRPLVTADLPVAILLSYLETTNSTVEMAFSSATYTLAPGMTLTPPAGTHWCAFSTSLIPTTSSAFFDIAIFVNGVIVPHTVRHATGSSSYYNPHTLAVVSTPGGQTVDVRWRKMMGAGTADMYERSLYCLRIG